MSALVEVRELRKEFLLSHNRAASLKTMFLWWQRRKSLEHLEVLKGVSFDVDRGQCLSLIGRNGAGKSTLLSLVSRVYKPTSGTITVHGRVAPLLELGAGFHPDLTGSENLVFNAMMLGLSRKQARERSTMIAEFSELGGHMDAPVRSYSSGMLARLGFAVAVNVDAEVLIVDEVLAVGDIAFERKCYDRIAKFKAEGGAILFVSHNMAAVERFSDRVIYLENGEVAADGKPETVIPIYRQAME
jgi:ABC-type polysaccharide/polyol phosphate transport system ATPase subunit